MGAAFGVVAWSQMGALMECYASLGIRFHPDIGPQLADSVEASVELIAEVSSLRPSGQLMAGLVL